MQKNQDMQEIQAKSQVMSNTLTFVYHGSCQRKNTFMGIFKGSKKKSRIFCLTELRLLKNVQSRLLDKSCQRMSSMSRQLKCFAASNPKPMRGISKYWRNLINILQFTNRLHDSVPFFWVKKSPKKWVNREESWSQVSTRWNGFNHTSL